MSPTIAEQLPDPETLLALEPEELAGVLLMHLNGIPRDPHAPARPDVHPGNFTNEGDPQGFGSFPRPLWNALGRAFMEAWAWLVREGLVVRKPGPSNYEWMVISRRGERIRSKDDFREYRAATRLPPGLLHTDIEERTRGSFLRGDYETAVFQAFRTLEIRVRDVCGYTTDDHGAPMMRKAFAPNSGPLADRSLPTGEQEGVAHLFAGAIQYIRNATAHRPVDIHPDEGVELLMFASHLLRIVNRRADKSGPPP